jgi:HlyD family secretion protein
LGLASVNTIQVLDGLKVGDMVVLSDMNQWDSHDRIRFNH